MIEKITAKHGLFIFASFLAFFVLSIPYNLQGPNAPVTMEYYGITAAGQGFIMTIQSAGNICTAIILALRGERYNKIHAIAVGVLILCLACSAVGFAPVYTGLLVLVCVIGIGAAFVDVMMNGVITDVYTKQRNTILPLVHGFFGLGAMAAPIFVTMMANPDVPETFSIPYRVLGAVAAATFAVYFFSGRRIVPETPYRDMEATKRRAIEDPAEVFKTKRAWFFLAVGVLYFTFQLGTNMWLPTYTMRNVGADFDTAGMMLTAYFGGALPMRMLGPLFLRKLSARAIFWIFGFMSAAFMLLALFTENIAVMFVFVAASGFMQGSSAPVFILMCCETFPERTASASSLCAISAGTAALTAPLWMRGLSEFTGFLLPMILICCSMFVSAGLIFLKGGGKAAA